MQISGNRTEPSLVSKPHAKVFPNQMPQIVSLISFAVCDGELS